MKMPYQLQPVIKPHNNLILKGWKDKDGNVVVKDLGVTKTIHEGQDTPRVYSIWKVESIWERIKFLFKGEIMLGVSGNTAPPVSVDIGEYDFPIAETPIQ